MHLLEDLPAIRPGAGEGIPDAFPQSNRRGRVGPSGDPRSAESARMCPEGDGRDRQITKVAAAACPGTDQRSSSPAEASGSARDSGTGEQIRCCIWWLREHAGGFEARRNRAGTAIRGELSVLTALRNGLARAGSHQCWAACLTPTVDTRRRQPRLGLSQRISEATGMQAAFALFRYQETKRRRASK